MPSDALARARDCYALRAWQDELFKLVRGLLGADDLLARWEGRVLVATKRDRAERLVGFALRRLADQGKTSSHASAVGF